MKELVRLISVSVRLLRWAQETVVIPAGLESDVQEAIIAAQQQSAQVDVCLFGGKHEFRELSNGEYTKVACSKCGKRRDVNQKVSS